MRKEIIGGCELYLGDAFEIVPTLSQVNSCIIDPPFELSNKPPGSSHYGMSLSKFESSAYKDIVAGFDMSIFDHIEKICQPFNMFCFCSNKQISKIMAYHEAKKRSATLLVWHKTNAVPFANGVWRGDIEYIVHAKDAGATFQGNAVEKKKVFEYPIVNNLEHPTVKPLGLISRLVKICSNPGDIIMDCFMGSGTTGVACARMDRQFIGIESNATYFDLACKRIEQAYKQPDLFIEKIISPEQLTLE